MKLDGGSQSFNIFNVLQLVCIVSNPSVSYFDTVDIGPWSGLLVYLTSMVTGSFSPGVLVVYKLYLVSIMTTVMGKGLGGIVGLNLGHFFKFDGLEWCVPDICWSRCLLFGTLPQEELKMRIEDRV